MAEDREESLEELLKQNAELKEDIQRLEQQRKALERMSTVCGWSAMYLRKPVKY